MTASFRASEIASQLASLISDDPYRSDYIQQLGDACKRDIAEAAPLYQNLSMWGGMGSFVDEAGVLLAAEQRNRVNDLIISLFEEFERCGIHYDRANSWIDTFRRWRDDDIFRKLKT